MNYTGYLWGKTWIAVQKLGETFKMNIKCLKKSVFSNYFYFYFVCNKNFNYKKSKSNETILKKNALAYGIFIILYGCLQMLF